MDSMVALPGTLCAPSIFDPLAEQLRDDLTLEVYSWLTEPGPWDIPTIAARLGEHLARSTRRPALVCGHSTGGAIALQLAVTRPDLVGGLLLVDTGAHMRGHGDVDAIVRRVRDEWGAPLHAAVLDRSFHVAPRAADRSRLLSWAAAVDPRAAYEVLASQRDLDLANRLAELSMPTIVVHGQHDRARPPAQGVELAASIPQAVLRLLPTGHTPMYEAPVAFAAVVRELQDRRRDPSGYRVLP